MSRELTFANRRQCVPKSIRRHLHEGSYWTPNPYSNLQLDSKKYTWHAHLDGRRSTSSSLLDHAGSLHPNPSDYRNFPRRLRHVTPGSPTCGIAQYYSLMGFNLSLFEGAQTGTFGHVWRDSRTQAGEQRISVCSRT